MIVTSLLVASIGLPRLLRGLELPEEPTDRLEEDLARRESSRAALAAVEKLRQRLVQDSEHADLYNEAANRVSALYQRHLDHGEAMESDPEEARRLDAVLRQLRHAGLQAERQELFKLTRQRKISDEIARRLIRNLDLLEARRKS
ncbi:hypothetical protein NB689_001962 [Xanthomonas sacchari]|nr:hypothetical protein [Xanthomonas sacchari]